MKSSEALYFEVTEAYQYSLHLDRALRRGCFLCTTNSSCCGRAAGGTWQCFCSSKCKHMSVASLICKTETRSTLRAINKANVEKEFSWYVPHRRWRAALVCSRALIRPSFCKNVSACSVCPLEIQALLDDRAATKAERRGYECKS